MARTPFIRKTFFLLTVALRVSVPALWSQTEDPATGEILENLFRDNEQAAESDAQSLVETLENLGRHRLDLNRASREDLAGLNLLSPVQVENFLEYRARFAPLLNVYELQAIPGWNLEDIRRILPFAAVQSDLQQRSRPLHEGFWAGENALLFRWGRPVPPPYTTAVEGAPNAWALRFRHTFDERLRFGFTAENDPGEAFFRGSNSHGFDFYSAHLFFQNVNPVLKTVALGDYSARFGQGLLLQTGFSPGKSAETTSVARGGRKLGAYASFGEAFFLRGAAASVTFGKNWECTMLFSRRHRDANIDTLDQDFPEQVFSSLQTAGLHRTDAEIADEKAIREFLGGISLAHSWKNGQIALNALHLQYDKAWQPSTAPYRRFAFAGKKLTGVSADYFWRRRNWFAFGEFARSDNGGMASVNGLLIGVDRRVNLALVHRSLGRDYQSVYASPFAETSGAANEHGLYLGADARFGKKWQVSAYADVWRHPWLRFGVSAPSVGSEYLTRITWVPQRGVSMYALWQLEIKEKNGNAAEQGFSGLVETRRGRFRLHAAYKLGPVLELRSRMEWTTYQIEDQPRNTGFLAYQEAVFRPLGAKVYGSARYTIFDTQDFDTRVYVFENDLFTALSIPSFSGRGSRYFINLTWRVGKHLRLEGRYEQTTQRQVVTDSGRVGRKTGWKFQVQYLF